MECVEQVNDIYGPGDVVRFGCDNQAAVVHKVTRKEVHLSYSDEFGDEVYIVVNKKYVRA